MKVYVVHAFSDSLNGGNPAGVVFLPKEVAAVSRRLSVAGVHMSCPAPEKDVTACCSNFAPYYGIDEECATGTSNAGLTYYLYRKGMILLEEENCFLQGEHMGRPSKIYSRVQSADGDVSVRIGGKAVFVSAFIQFS